jgi:hypothetical protein
MLRSAAGPVPVLARQPLTLVTLDVTVMSTGAAELAETTIAQHSAAATAP